MTVQGSEAEPGGGRHLASKFNGAQHLALADKIQKPFLLRQIILCPYPNLAGWLRRVASRPAVEEASTVPELQIEFLSLQDKAKDKFRFDFVSVKLGTSNAGFSPR